MDRAGGRPETGGACPDSNDFRENRNGGGVGRGRELQHEHVSGDAAGGDVAPVAVEADLRGERVHPEDGLVEFEHDRNLGSFDPVDLP